MLKNKKLFKFFSGLGAIILLGSVSCNILAMNSKRPGKPGQHKLSDEERQRKNDLKAQKRERAAEKRKREEERLQRQEFERAKEEYEAGREERERIAKLKAEEIERRKREREAEIKAQEEEKRIQEEIRKVEEEIRNAEEKNRRLGEMNRLLEKNKQNFEIELKDAENSVFSVIFFCPNLTKEIVSEAIDACSVWDGMQIEREEIKFDEFLLKNVNMFGSSTSSWDTVKNLSFFCISKNSDIMCPFKNYIRKLTWENSGNIIIQWGSFLLCDIEEVEINCGGTLDVCSFSFSGSNLNRLKINSRILNISGQGFNDCTLLEEISIVCSGDINIKNSSFSGCIKIFEFIKQKININNNVQNRNKGKYKHRHKCNKENLKNVSVHIVSEHGNVYISEYAITKEEPDVQFDIFDLKSPFVEIDDYIDILEFFKEDNVHIIKN